LVAAIDHVGTGNRLVPGGDPWCVDGEVHRQLFAGRLDQVDVPS
jgi:hypothetical protein